MSEDDDAYIFPSFPSTLPLAHTGLHMSFHASGQSHLRLNNYPISCLHVGPKLKVPFSKTQFFEDIIAKKNSLFTEIDLSHDHKAGAIAVLKAESVLRNFLGSEYVKNRLNEPKFIDYYNLILTNPYLPSSHFRSLYPFRNLEIDALSIGNAFRYYEGDDLYKLFVSLKKKKKIIDTDIVSLMPYDQSYFIIMFGDSTGLKIELNDPEGIIKKLPGGKTLYEELKKLDIC